LRAVDALANPDTWVSLLTLTVLEIVLGIDNLVFISILSSKLPPAQQARARKLGLAAALISRLLLLTVLAWVIKLVEPFWEPVILGQKLALSGKALILIVGGLFLIAKATHEIHDKLEGEDGAVTRRLPPTFASVIFQIMLLDIVFSLDSVITAVGMAQLLWVMITAVILAVIVMLAFVQPISAFVDRHPTVKMLALSFLILIGVVLVAEGLGRHIPKGYIYFAMAFSVGVEMLNLKLHSRLAHKVELHQPYR
jgi:predicted tellurium resistance membrane protein TerC